MVAEDATPPRVWWDPEFPQQRLLVDRGEGRAGEVEVWVSSARFAYRGLPDGAVELRPVPAGREDMCSQMGCGLDRGSVVQLYSHLLRGMARRVGEFRALAALFAASAPAVPGTAKPREVSQLVPDHVGTYVCGCGRYLPCRHCPEPTR